MENVKIEKVRIGCILDRITGEVEFQLQFKMVGQRTYRGFSEDTFGSRSVAKDAMAYHLSGEAEYSPKYLLNGKWWICRISY